MGFGVEIRNDNGNIVINQSYNNLCFSRKLKASDLTVETISTGTSWVMGSFRARRIPLQQNEVLAACGRSQGEAFCPYAISYGIKGVNSGATAMQPYLFALRKFYPNNFIRGTGPWVWWDDPDSEDTGISDPSAVANDLYVYTFKRSSDLDPSDLDRNGKVGLQVRDSNNNVLYDSRVPSARVLYCGDSSFIIPSGRKVAIAPVSVNLCGDGWLGDSPAFYVSGVGTHRDVADIVTTGGSMRVSISGGMFYWNMPGPDYDGSEYIVLDVTNF